MIRSVVRGIGSYLPAKSADQRRPGHDGGHLGRVDRPADRASASAVSPRKANSPPTSPQIAARAGARKRRPRAADIDLIVLATSTPDNTFPATAVTVQNQSRHPPRRGLRPAGGLLRLRLCARDGRCAAEDRAGQARPRHRRGDVLAHPRLERPHDLRALRRRRRRASCWRRRRAPAATADRGILTSHLRSDGQHKDKLYVDGGPSATGTVGHVRMEGREVFKHAVGMISDVINAAFEATGTGPRTSTGSCRTRPTSGSSTRAPRSSASRRRRSCRRSTRHGNTSAASIPLALDVAVADGRIKPGHLVMLEAMGGGFTWGSALRPLVICRRMLTAHCRPA